MDIMSAAEVAALNRDYAKQQAADPDESSHILIHRVAVAHNLEQVRHVPGGWLYRSRTGRHVVGAESGGFKEAEEGTE